MLKNMSSYCLYFIVMYLLRRGLTVIYYKNNPKKNGMQSLLAIQAEIRWHRKWLWLYPNTFALLFCMLQCMFCVVHSASYWIIRLCLETENKIASFRSRYLQTSLQSHIIWTYFPLVLRPREEKAIINKCKIPVPGVLASTTFIIFHFPPGASSAYIRGFDRVFFFSPIGRFTSSILLTGQKAGWVKSYVLATCRTQLDCFWVYISIHYLRVI